MPIEAGLCRVGFCANPTRVQRTERNFVVRIAEASNNVARNNRKEGNLTAKSIVLDESPKN